MEVKRLPAFAWIRLDYNVEQLPNQGVVQFSPLTAVDWSGGRDNQVHLLHALWASAKEGMQTIK